ncbi:hypothetical protein Scep_027525 [Stephania cephalantha]|uniref:Uncharacterized protein n=1 Tax=Stephania cephalantha TaxID=152367 RepID=A0AAP0EBD3_9MAGN
MALLRNLVATSCTRLSSGTPLNSRLLQVTPASPRILPVEGCHGILGPPSSSQTTTACDHPQLHAACSASTYSSSHSVEESPTSSPPTGSLRWLRTRSIF